MTNLSHLPPITTFPRLCYVRSPRRSISHCPVRHLTRASSTLHVSGCLGGVVRFPTFLPVSVAHPLEAGSLPLSIQRLTRTSSTLHLSGCLGGFVCLPTFPRLCVVHPPQGTASPTFHTASHTSTLDYTCLVASVRLSVSPPSLSSLRHLSLQDVVSRSSTIRMALLSSFLDVTRVRVPR